MEEEKKRQNKIQRIREGWDNIINPKPEVEALSDSRMNICSNCTNNVLGVCVLCGCPLMSKTRATEEMCPINKW